MAELDAIKDSRVRDPDVYAMAAELLEERGDERGALLMHRRRDLVRTVHRIHRPLSVRAPARYSHLKVDTGSIIDLIEPP
jgi:hypothetical protein